MSNKPIVDASDQVVLIGSAIDASEIFTASDPDGDDITKYRVRDSVDGGGYFSLDGVVLSANVVHEIDAADLSKLKYHGGSAIGNEQITIYAYDGTNWSDAASVAMYTVQEDTGPPILDLPNMVILENEWIRMSDVVTAYDPDGRPIEWYGIKDRTAGNGTGIIIYKNEFHTQNTWLWVKAEDLKNVYYAPGLPGYTEFLDMWAYDGQDWVNDWGWMGIRANNNTPTVQPKTFTVPTFSKQNPAEFVEVVDEDGSTMKRYLVYDGNDLSSSGYFMLDNNSLDAGVWHNLTAGQFNRLEFYASGENMTEELMFRAFDGKYTSDAASITFTTVPTPSIGGTSLLIENQLEFSSFSDYFTQTDPGPSFTSYQVYVKGDDPVGSKLFMQGIEMNNNQVYDLTANEFNQLVMRTGAYEQRSRDQFQVRGNNGTFWSDWATLEVSTEPEHERGLYFGSAYPSQNWHQFITGSPLVITYSFFQAHPGDEYPTGAADPDEFSQLTPNQRAAVRRAFGQLMEFTNLQFVEVPDTIVNQFGGDGGVIRFGNYFDPDDTAAAFAYPPVSPFAAPNGGDIWFNLAFMNPNRFDENRGEFATTLHEIGHAIGLKHTFDGSAVLPPPTESSYYSVMSYTAPVGVAERTFQLYDVKALQRLYGTNFNTRSGDDVYSMDDTYQGSSRIVATIWDGGGTDRIDTSDSFFDNRIDIRQGGLSRIDDPNTNIKVAFKTEIENATGGFGDDTIIGNYLDNVLVGNDGQDWIYGGVGNDYMMGGAHSDTYYVEVGDGKDEINEEAKAGRDTIVFGDHPWVDGFGEDFSFRKDGRDMIISLTLNGETAHNEIRVINQEWGGYRIESLEFGSNRVDLVDLFTQLTSVDQQFRITGDTTIFGSIASPI